jgi:ribonuclease P protein component
MKRAYRLRRPDQFRRARLQGQTYAAPMLTLNVVPGRRRRTRCGFVVSKQLGTAVRRNRAKRRVREAVRLLLPSIKPGYDIVFVVRGPELLSAPFVAISQTAEQLLRRAQIWSDEVAAASAAPPATGDPPAEPTE